MLGEPVRLMAHDQDLGRLVEGELDRALDDVLARLGRAAIDRAWRVSGGEPSATGQMNPRAVSPCASSSVCTRRSFSSSSTSSRPAVAWPPGARPSRNRSSDSSSRRFSSASISGIARRCASIRRGALDVDLEVAGQPPAQLVVKLALDAVAQLGWACDQQPVERPSLEALEQDGAGSADVLVDFVLDPALVASLRPAALGMAAVDVVEHAGDLD